MWWEQRSLLSCIAPPVKRTVTLTYNEYYKLSKSWEKNFLGEKQRKLQQTGYLETACDLWGDAGNPEHIIMRDLGRLAVAEYLSQRSYWRIGDCGQWLAIQKPSCTFLSPKFPETPTETEPKKEAVPAVIAPVVPGFGPANRTWEFEGRTDLESDLLIHLDKGHMVDRGGAFPGVVGKTKEDRSPLEIKAVAIMPVSADPCVYANTPENVETAIEERITKKEQECRLNESDNADLKRRIGNIGRTATAKVFTRKAIAEWVAENPLWECAKSGKWTNTRWQNAEGDVVTATVLKYQHKYSIKAEGMKHNKPPRLLIADGDAGQVMGCYAMACMEAIIKKHFPNCHVKGRAKKQAMNEIFKHLRFTPEELGGKGVTAYEGDGSAWDTKCSKTLRDATENVVVWHILDVLIDMVCMTSENADAMKQAMGKKKIRGTFEDKNKEAKRKFITFVINSIRRSGDRGTSILNWWVNMVCTMACLFLEPEIWVENPTVTELVDVSGELRKFKFVWEGDDSGGNTSPPMNSELQKMVEHNWRELGHDMKLFFRPDWINIVGVVCPFDNCGPLPDEWCPELPRAMQNSGLTTSSTATLAWAKNDAKTIKAVAASKAMSRALDFAGKLPTVSEKYLNYAEALGFRSFDPAEVESAELMFRHAVTEDALPTDLAERVREENGKVATGTERKRLRLCQWPATIDELAAFRDYSWDPENLMDVEGFRASLPATWRS